MRAAACGWCHGELTVTAKPAVYCSHRCRQSAYRFRVEVGRGARPEGEARRLAYADPPYPGLSARYYRGHPDYAGEVDHAALLSRLEEYDGWALSTSATALRAVLSLPGARDARVAAWVRGGRPGRTRNPVAAWEPVLYRPARTEVRAGRAEDALVHVARPRVSDPRRVVGAKPGAFAGWLFGLLDARPGDSLEDLFPGSGGIGRAWALWANPSRGAGVTRGSL